MFPGFISQDFEKLVKSRGTAFLLDALKLRWGKDTVEKLHSTLEELPLGSSGGFMPNVPAIDRVVKQLHTFLREREMKKDDGDRPSSMLELTWPFGGLYGEIMMEKGASIAFI